MRRRNCKYAVVLALVTTAAVAASSPQIAIDRAALVAKVRAEFQHAWTSYTRLAAGHDELNPLSKTPHDWYPPAVVYMTPVDALDTLVLMRFTAETEDTRKLVRERLSFDMDVSVQVFEINIRLLGALLSAYQMLGDREFLTLADDLGTRLLPAFNSPTGMPYRFVNLRTGAVRDPESNPAEIGTLILEFGTLAKLTKKDVYFEKAKRALTALYDRRAKSTDLIGEGMNVETGAWTNRSSHVGGGIDSYFEYALKCDRLFNDADCRTIAKTTISAVNRYLADDRPSGLWFGEADMETGRRTGTNYGALHAFLPTVFALQGDFSRARRLQASNYTMWTTWNIEPEEMDYSTMRVVRAGYQLRPEIVESAYYLFHYTKDPVYLRMGARFLDDLIKYCRTDDGYTVLGSVVTKEKGDRMHSFLLAETFKYLYLLFAPDDTIDFDHVTFNTEAHPLKRTW